ncbi:MAG: hypothetical protein ACHBNF_09420 [Chromatiales bacterium]
MKKTIDSTEEVAAKEPGGQDNSREHVPQIDRLFARGKRQLSQILASGDMDQLERCVASLQLALTYVEALPIQDQAPSLRKIADCLVQAFAAGKNDPRAPIQSDQPLVFVISYPRSGNTPLIQTVAALLGAQVFAGVPHSLTPFAKQLYPRHYPLVRLVKDHVAREIYLRDRAIILVRDGRDAMTSLAYMTLQQGRHSFSRRGDLAEFLVWLDKEYDFGGWANHMKQVDHLMGGADKLLIRYEDFMAGPTTLKNVVDYIDPKHGFSSDEIAERYEAKSVIWDGIRNHPANNQWGIGLEFAPDSLFHEWSRNRQGSHWRRAWDLEAKKAFHETGATEYLLRYGYETDPEWWKRAP